MSVIRVQPPRRCKRLPRHWYLRSITHIPLELREQIYADLWDDYLPTDGISAPFDYTDLLVHGRRSKSSVRSRARLVPKLLRSHEYSKYVVSGLVDYYNRNCLNLGRGIRWEDLSDFAITDIFGVGTVPTNVNIKRLTVLIEMLPWVMGPVEDFDTPDVREQNQHPRRNISMKPAGMGWAAAIAALPSTLNFTVVSSLEIRIEFPAHQVFAEHLIPITTTLRSILPSLEAAGLRTTVTIAVSPVIEVPDVVTDYADPAYRYYEQRMGPPTDFWEASAAKLPEGKQYLYHVDIRDMMRASTRKWFAFLWEHQRRWDDETYFQAQMPRILAQPDRVEAEDEMEGETEIVFDVDWWNSLTGEDDEEMEREDEAGEED